jgi:hypothetical protein
VPSELGSFRGNFKEAVGKLRALLGLKEGEDLGFVYDKPIGPLKDSRHTLLVCVKLCDLSVRDECAPSCHPPIHTTNPLRNPSATPPQPLTKPSPNPHHPHHRPTVPPPPQRHATPTFTPTPTLTPTRAPAPAPALHPMCIRPYGLGFKGAWVEHEAFENPHYKAYCGVDTVAVPVLLTLHPEPGPFPDH